MNSKDFVRFDMSKPPQNIKWYLKPIAKILGILGVKQHKTQIEYVGTENIKGPFILLCNHNAFLDFKVANYVLGKNKANYVVAIDGFLKREWLLRTVGCICKRKFTSDITLVKQLKKVVENGNVAVVYPEARYSLCGTTAVLPRSLGKMIKLFKVPVVTLVCHGHHINSPFWDSSHERKVKPTQATYKLLLTQKDVKDLSTEEINERIVKEFQYDDFKWQLENKIKISEPKRAEGLHKVLYQCPHCCSENTMSSSGTILKCNNCNKEWEMTEYGQLKALRGETEFSHIPDWYEWERKNVAKEVEDGVYSSGELKVKVKSLPKDEFIDLGEGTLIHNMNGFEVAVTDKDGDEHKMIKEVSSLYSCHIEYNYLFKYGDCIDLNTLDDTWYIFPEGDNFSTTKMALATEELYRKLMKKENKKMQEGIL